MAILKICQSFQQKYASIRTLRKIVQTIADFSINAITIQKKV